MDELLDLLDIAAKNYPIKALAPEIGKGESTLRNELTQQPGYKLGLFTAIQIMKKTDDLRAMDRIEELFGRVAFSLPHPDQNDMMPLMAMIGQMAKEYGENVSQMGEALRDGVITKKEARHCKKENDDLIRLCIKLDAYLRKIIEIREL